MNSSVMDPPVGDGVLLGTCFAILVASLVGAMVLVASNLTQLYANSKGKKIKTLIRNRQERRWREFLALRQRLDKLLRVEDATGGGREEWARIRGLSCTQLLEEMRDGKVTAVSVLRAYQYFAMKATDRLNCVVEFITEAEDWAAKLDEQGPGSGGPLHGLPISCKENVFIAGYDSTIGLGKLIGQPADEDAVLIATLKNLGAIPFCRTNVPQMMAVYDCSNPIFGRTANPYDLGRSPGGSSGGEGALVSEGGSLFGVGSDAAGSLRNPAAYSGCVSLKPTSGRVSQHGMRDLDVGNAGLGRTLGFFSRNVDALSVVWKELMTSKQMQTLDPTVPFTGFDTEKWQSTRPLRIGFYDDDELFPATPGCRRAVDVAKSALLKAGHELVQWAPYNPDEMIHIFVDILLADGNRTLKKNLEGEEIDLCMKPIGTGARIPVPDWVTTRLISRLVAPFSKNLSGSLASGAKLTSELWACLSREASYRQKFIASMREHRLDALLSPVMATPALLNDYPTYLMFTGSYSVFFNVLDFPAGVVPVTFETEEDQKLLREEYPTPKEEITQKWAKEGSLGAEGLPLAVQIASLPWAEETVLKVMKDLEQSIGPLPLRHSIESNNRVSPSALR